MRAAFVVAAWLCGPVLLRAAEAPPAVGYGPLPRGAWACLGSPRFVGVSPARSVAFSPDGRLLATGSGDYGPVGDLIHVWDLASGRELHRLRGHTGQVVALRFTPDRKRLVSAAWDNAVRVWDLEIGKEERQFKGHERVLMGLELSPDGKQLLTSSQDGTIRVWHFGSGLELRRMKCMANAISLSPDGRTLAAASSEGLILWDVRTGRRLRQIGDVEVPGPVDVRFAPDGKTLAVRDGGCRVSLWDVAAGKRRLEIKGLRRPVLSVAFSPDGKILVTGGGGYEQPGPFAKNFLSELKLWDATSGELLRSCEGTTTYSDLAFSPDGRTLATAGDDFTTRLWDVKTGRESLRFAGHAHEVMSLVYSSDAGTLYSASLDGTIRIWDARQVRERAVLRGHTQGVLALALTPDDKTLASGGRDGRVRLWETADRQSRLLADNHGEVGCLAFSPDGRRLATGDYGYGGTGGTVRVWDWRQGLEVYRAAGQEGAHSLAFSPDGATLAVGHHPHIYIRDAASGKLRHQFMAHGEFVRPLAFLPDGKLVSAGEGDRVMQKAVRLWDVAEPARLHQFGAADGYTTTMAVSPDGRLLAWSCETTIRLYELSTRFAVGEYHGHRRHVASLAFSPDGLTLASGGADGAILLWDLSGHRPDGRWRTAPLEPGELSRQWEELADLRTGRRAMWRLVAAPEQAVPFLARRVLVVPRLDPARVRRLVADLDSDTFATRESATRELTKLGPPVIPLLTRALRDENWTPEAVRRLKMIVEMVARAKESSSPLTQTLRAVEALEHIGTPEANELLRRLADGEPGARQTQEARAALARLARLSP